MADWGMCADSGLVCGAVRVVGVVGWWLAAGLGFLASYVVL